MGIGSGFGLSLKHCFFEVFFYANRGPDLEEQTIVKVESKGKKVREQMIEERLCLFFIVMRIVNIDDCRVANIIN